MAPASPQSNALLLLFPGFNTLDANGPLEIFRKSGTSKVFTVTIASETELTTAAEGVTVKRHIALDDDHLRDSLELYDLLIVPGGPATGPESAVQKQANTSGPFMHLISRFAQLPAISDSHPRILLSICTGALFLSKLGLFNAARPCTTHWGAYSTLAEFNLAASAAADPPAQPGTVLPARFVDSGLNENQVRIISSGGISCGMDASLHVVGLRAGEEEAFQTARLLDYRWQKTEGVVFGEEFMKKG